ncbi:helix-turn-helix transcriptional regulator [Natronosporangium hydrolyticum]|uniref:Helix-turn-helix transcriptional regulator n=1 Tax=Natronosporangium hydrolyticum TaxID=2811111 RepID=A0A895YHA1_9ACTN|nr:helix-turn-helix transcriptional regulator [Natronosporangium hydrolyticum]
MPEHPVRVALLDLLAQTGTLTATDAARRLGYSSGLCSFHLRQLASHGLIEEAPAGRGRVRPWRLRWQDRPKPVGGEPPVDGEPVDEELARSLEDESYQRWRAARTAAPAAWRNDEAFSEVVHLSPTELTELADTIRSALGRYRDRSQPATRPGGTAPVAAIVRLFPLLGDEAPSSGAQDS